MKKVVNMWDVISFVLVLVALGVAMNAAAVQSIEQMIVALVILIVAVVLLHTLGIVVKRPKSGDE